MNEMDEKKLRRQKIQAGMQRLVSGLIRLLLVVLFVYLVIKYFFQ